MESGNINNAITLRMKKTTRTAFWYQLNDLIDKIKLYKARFQTGSPTKSNKSMGKKMKKSPRRVFGTSKILHTQRINEDTNGFDSPIKNCKYLLVYC